MYNTYKKHPSHFKITHLFFISIILLGCLNHLTAQSDTIHINLYENLPGIESFFDVDTPFICTLKLNLKEYQREKNNGKYQKAHFIYKLNDSLISKVIRVKARGVVRRRICAVPPMRLNIQKVNKDQKLAHGASKLKMVTHCNYSSEYKDYILKEYLTYKSYNIITNYSFKVRLLRITYIDTGRKNKETTTWAFAIEPLEMLAERLNCVPIKMNSLGIFYTDTVATDILSLWSYMVGNTDWSVVGRHNIKIIKSKDHNQPAPIAIPYDFDYTGLVNTHYALPGDGLGLGSVQERLFIGPCRNIENYKLAANHIINKKESLENLINNFDYLSYRTRKEMLYYLNSFFGSIERTNFIKYHIDIDCRESSSQKSSSFY